MNYHCYACHRTFPQIPRAKKGVVCQICRQPISDEKPSAYQTDKKQFINPPALKKVQAS